MVEIKIRKGDIGKIDSKIDVEMEAPVSVLLWTLVELEQTLYTLLHSLEEKTGLQIHESFLENVADRFDE